MLPNLSLMIHTGKTVSRCCQRLSTAEKTLLSEHWSGICPVGLLHVYLRVRNCHYWSCCIWYHAGIATCVLDKCSELTFNYEFVEDIYDFEKKATPRGGDSGTDTAEVDGADDPGTDASETDSQETDSEGMPGTRNIAEPTNGRLVIINFMLLCIYMYLCMHALSVQGQPAPKMETKDSWQG